MTIPDYTVFVRLCMIRIYANFQPSIIVVHLSKVMYLSFYTKCGVYSNLPCIVHTDFQLNKSYGRDLPMTYIILQE